MVPVFAIAGLLLLGACASAPDPDIDLQTEKSVSELYNDALDTALSGDLVASAPKFEEVERQHPYSIWSIRAQIMAAWSFYQGNKYPQADASLDRFIELYPADPLTEYAYYLKALIYYEQIVDVERDAYMTHRALAAFEDLLRRYPESIYARDARLKADLARSHLAGKEMAVGRFYLKRGFYGAAIRRFNNVINNYDRTNQVPEALYRMSEAYLSLGLQDEAKRTAQVADYNFPNSIWTNRLHEVIDNPARSGTPGTLDNVVTRALSIF